MTKTERLRIRRLQARAVNVPLGRPIQTGGGLVATAPLVLVDLETEEGLTGASYVFCYTTLALRPVAQLLGNLAEVVEGHEVAPVVLGQSLSQRFRLLGSQGITGMAMAGIDMAAWDALAKAAGLPLVRLLGGDLRPVRAYNSCGLGIIGPEHAAAEARELAAPGFRALKVRLGYPDLETDVAVVRAVREAAGPHVALMADYNQSLSVPEAIRRGRRLDDEGLAWIEEPTLAEDYAGHALIRREVRTPIQAGENWWGVREVGKALEAGACDLVMPDVMKVGGVSGWLRAAALAEAAGTPISSHLFPEFSAHLLAATPARDWLEYAEFANPVLQEPVRVAHGEVALRDTPGAGVAWDEDAVRRYLVE